MTTILLPPELCIYCGNEFEKVRRGEHIVPEAIGGRWTIYDVCGSKKVCNTCNNGILSELDQELCSKSIMSAVAADEIGGFIAQTWDVDHVAGDLLIEAKPDLKRMSMITYPQMIFEPTGPQIRGDLEELRQFGSEEFWTLFVKRVREAYGRYRDGERRSLHEHRVGLNEYLLKRYRHPPRIFTRKPMSKFRRGMSFEFHYLDVDQKLAALSQLENWQYDYSQSETKTRIGSELPTFRFFYDSGKVLRALAKIAINLLAAYCPRTPINRDAFGPVIRRIVGESIVEKELVDSVGFVEAKGIQPISVPSAHSFRLVHESGFWHVHMSFFGGRIGAYMGFPGQNREAWRTADIVMPLKAGEPSVQTSRMIHRLPYKVEIKDFRKIVPSIEAVNVESISVTKEVRLRSPRKSHQPPPPPTH